MLLNGRTMIKCHLVGKHYRNGQMDRLFVSSMPKVDPGLCTRTWIHVYSIHVYSISQLSVYRTIGPLVL